MFPSDTKVKRENHKGNNFFAFGSDNITYQRCVKRYNAKLEVKVFYFTTKFSF